MVRAQKSHFCVLKSELLKGAERKETASLGKGKWGSLIDLTLSNPPEVLEIEQRVKTDPDLKQLPSSEGRPALKKRTESVQRVRE